MDGDDAADADAVVERVERSYRMCCSRLRLSAPQLLIMELQLELPVMSDAGIAADEDEGAQCVISLTIATTTSALSFRVGGHACLNLSHEFFMRQLFTPQPLDEGGGALHERSSAVLVSDASGWDWWFAEWLRSGRP